MLISLSFLLRRGPFQNAYHMTCEGALPYLCNQWHLQKLARNLPEPTRVSVRRQALQTVRLSHCKSFDARKELAASAHPEGTGAGRATVATTWCSSAPTISSCCEKKEASSNMHRNKQQQPIAEAAMLATENRLQGNYQRAASKISWRNSTAAWRYTKQEQLLSCLQQHKGEQVQLQGMQMATGCNGNTKTAMRESRERTRQHGYWQKGKTH